MVTVSFGAEPVTAPSDLTSDVSHAASNVMPSSANINNNTFPAFPPVFILNVFITYPF
jgi:hypothetical protein